jgi:hypothetical protein
VGLRRVFVFSGFFQCVPKVFFAKKVSDIGFSAFLGIVRDFVGIEFLHFWAVRGLFGRRRGFFGNHFPEISGDFRRFTRVSHDYFITWGRFFRRSQKIAPNSQKVAQKVAQQICPNLSKNTKKTKLAVPNLISQKICPSLGKTKKTQA